MKTTKKTKKVYVFFLLKHVYEETGKVDVCFFLEHAAYRLSFLKVRTVVSCWDLEESCTATW